MSIVLYCLGGAWVAEFSHAALGMPGLTTIKWHCTTSIQASPVFPTIDEAVSNLTSVCTINTPSSGCITGIVSMVDKIKVEEKLDWCPCTNSIIGLCHEHSQPTMHVFNHIDDAHVIFDDLAHRRVHLGTEVC